MLSTAPRMQIALTITSCNAKLGIDPATSLTEAHRISPRSFPRGAETLIRTSPRLPREHRYPLERSRGFDGPTTLLSEADGMAVNGVRAEKNRRTSRCSIA